MLRHLQSDYYLYKIIIIYIHLGVNHFDSIVPLLELFFSGSLHQFLPYIDIKNLLQSLLFIV